MRHILAGLSTLLLIAPACAQDGPHSHPAVDASIADLDARLDAAEQKNAAQDGDILLGLSEDDAIRARFDALALRVKALEDAAGAPVPPPDPTPEPEPDPDPLPPPDPTPPPSPGGNVLTINGAQRFQTINGWSVTTRAWEQDKVNDRYDPTARQNAPEMVDRLVNEAGVNRIRLEVQTGAENRRDYWADFVAGRLTYNELKAKYYEAFNDNADPFVADPAGFQWSQLDEKVESIVQPMQAALAAKGERLWVNLNVVDFGGGDSGDLDVATAPEEYAELVLEALKHLKSKYALTPDSLEIILEPDNGPTWTGAQIGAAIKAVESRLAAAGFSPQIIAPSTMRAGNALPYFNAIKAAGVSVDVLAFHTYGSTADADLAAIAATGAANGIETAMLEKTASGVDQLHRDLTLANSSAWLQWGLASKVDNGNYLLLGDLAQPEGARLSLASRTRGLSQIWRHVRRGYTRVGTSMNFAGVKALAFEAPGGGVVVAGITTRTKSFAISGLPAGDYGVEYTTDTALAVHAGDFTVAAGAALTVSIPDAGVIVVYPLGRAPPVTGEVQPDNSDGFPITQFGLGFHKDWQAESPYKNFFYLESASDFGRIASGNYDPDTGRLCLSPGEKRQLRPVRRTQQDGYDIDPGVWVVKARIDGTAAVSVGGFVETGSAPGEMRVAGDLTGRRDGQPVTLHGGISGGCVTPLFWGPEKYESDPDGWNPSFLAYVRGAKIIRAMDWSGVAGAKLTRAAQWVRDGSALIQYNSAAWSSVPPADPTLLRGGYQFGRMFDLSKKTGAAPWFNLPITLGGMSVERELYAASSSTTFETMKASIAANIDQIILDAEREFLALARTMAQSALNEGHPDSVVILVELHNELWNFGTVTFKRGSEYATGIGRGKTGADNSGYGQGYMAALMVAAVKEAFDEIKPNQQLAFVTGFQTGSFQGVGEYRARNAIAGFRQYESDARIAKSNIIDVWAGSTGYYSGAHKWTKKSPGAGNPFGASDEASFNAAFQASHEGDPTAHRARIRDWFIGPAANDNIGVVIANNVLIRDFAIANGMAGIIQYEGSMHDNIVSGAGSLGSVYTGAGAALLEFIRSAEGRAVQADAITRLRAINPTNPAKQHGWRPTELPIANYLGVRVGLSATSPWVERRADELGACVVDDTIGGAWCAAYRKVK